MTTINGTSATAMIRETGNGFVIKVQRHNYSGRARTIHAAHRDAALAIAEQQANR